MQPAAKPGLRVGLGVEDRRYTTQANGHSHAADKKQRLSPQFVDERHTQQGGCEIHQADQHSLQGTRQLAKAGGGENVIRVVENSVDARRAD